MARFVEVSASYPIPHNWKWDSIGNYAKIKSGYPFDSEKFSDDPTGRQPLIRIRDILKESTNTFTDECCPEEYIIHAGDILIGMDGDFNVGKWNGDDALLNQRVCYIQSNSNCLLNDYLYYYLPGILKIINNATPSVTVKHLSANTLRKTQIPLPPLAEQQRIVDRIESLFAKLDEAKEKAQAVVDSFETRKAAILHKAFTGELTAKWREERGVGMESWEKRRINELARPRAGYAFDSKKFSNTGYQVVRMGNLYGETLDLFRKPVFISEDDVDDSILNRALIKDGDILITLTGTKYKRDYGYAVCVSSPNKLLVNQRILCLTPFACVERNYLLYYLKSNLFRDVFFSCETGGVNQGNVSSKFVENIEIPIPTFDEQLEITTALDRTLAHEQQAKEAAEAVLAQIDLMKKSILARAFRGELGTNDPSEESAVELLKEIIRRG